MAFTSAAFLVLMGVVFGLHLVLPHRARNALLLVASYVFYGWWDWRFCGLILASSLVDYACAQWAAPAPGRSEGRRRAALLTSVTVNLGALGFFKYANFFVASARDALASLGVAIDTGTLDILLPVGISFYTFQTLSYTIDVWRGRLAPERQLDTFLLYVAFFPQLVAGPIERATHLLPQLRHPRRVTWHHVTSGASLALWGFWLKLVVADNLAPWVNATYALPRAGGASVAFATFAFAFQIYADFAGYTAIARGTARMLGISLRENFRMPYVSASPSEFWLRWHVSLSSWLRDYLYIPLGGNRRGPMRTRINLMVTMLLGGLWHGAAWNFVWWGAWHGALLGLWRMGAGRPRVDVEAPRRTFDPRRAAAVIVFFGLTLIGWLIFRADSTAQILAFVSALLAPWPDIDAVLPALPRLAMLVGPLVAMDIYRSRCGSLEPWLAWPLPARVALTVALFYAIVIFGAPYANRFLYFQF